MKINAMFRIMPLLLFATTAKAQNNAPERPYFPDIVAIQKADYSTAEGSYASCLKSDNGGVVESALAHIAMLKLMYPVREFNILAKAVAALAASDASPEIRYKAYLVKSLLNDPKQFASEARTDYASPDALFGALAARMHDVIVSNMTK